MTVDQKPVNGSGQRLSLLIIGAGVAGLSAAIEGRRQGFDVRILEKRDDVVDKYGDIVAIQTPALHTPKTWPGFLETVGRLAYRSVTTFHKYDGTVLGKFPIGDPNDPSLAINRSDFHTELLKYSQNLDIPIELSASVSDYYENDQEGGVVLADGRKLTADVVIAADGVGSISSMIITGKKDKAISSGFAVYRITYPLETAMKNPVLAEEFKDCSDRLSVHIGPGTHVVVGMNQRVVCWLLTHRDEGDSAESWARNASSDKALPYVEGWTPFVTELIKTTPDKACTDWKLRWRDPNPTWVSPCGRIVQIGDSAHSFLPSSGSGATMAMEDAFSLVACLKRAGEGNAPMALRVHNTLRFERASCAQKLGFMRREAWHNTDWDAVMKDPEQLNKLPDWIAFHHPAQYAYDNYDQCKDHILNGTLFKNTNFPPGYNFKPWTVNELLEAADKGIKVEDEGDWS